MFDLSNQQSPSSLNHSPFSQPLPPSLNHSPLLLSLSISKLCFISNHALTWEALDTILQHSSSNCEEYTWLFCPLPCHPQVAHRSSSPSAKMFRRLPTSLPKDPT